MPRRVSGGPGFVFIGGVERCDGALSALTERPRGAVRSPRPWRPSGSGDRAGNAAGSSTRGQTGSSRGKAPAVVGVAGADQPSGRSMRFLRNWGARAVRVLSVPPIDHTHRPLGGKVSISRYVSLLWSRRVDRPHPFIFAERPSEFISNAAMFHECHPANVPSARPSRLCIVGGEPVGGISDAMMKNSSLAIHPHRRRVQPSPVTDIWTST